MTAAKAANSARFEAITAENDDNAIDNLDWLDAVGEHPEMTADDAVAAFEFLGMMNSGLTDEQLAASHEKFVRLGFFTPILVLDTEPSFRWRFTIPKVCR
jgi:hypothetical protein